VYYGCPIEPNHRSIAKENAMADKGTSPARKTTQGVREIRLAISPNSDFETIAKTLKETLTLAEIGNFRGCRPCLSGLDRLILEDPEFQQFR
jgi:hypothetical protein